MKQKKYKAAVIGLGRIGAEERNYKKEVRPATHAAMYSKNPKIKLVALVDNNPEKLKRAGRQFPNAALFFSAKEMMSQIKPDIVSIATPPDSHLPLVKLAAEYGVKAIVCEKPIAGSLSQAKAIINICKKNKSMLFVNHQRRFDPLLRAWQAKIKKGIIGKVVQCSCFYYNGFLNNGTHVIDLLLFFLGKPKWVRAVENKETSWKKGDKDLDVLIEFKNKTRVAIQALPKNYVFSDICFFGKKGRVSITNMTYSVEFQKLARNKYFNGYYALSDKVEKTGKIRSFMEHVAENVVDCLQGRAKPYSTGEDAMGALKIIFAARKSAEKNGKIIKL